MPAAVNMQPDDDDDGGTNSMSQGLAERARRR